jgi:ABC-type transport system substrate-binding protein
MKGNYMATRSAPGRFRTLTTLTVFSLLLTSCSAGAEFRPGDAEANATSASVAWITTADEPVDTAEGVNAEAPLRVRFYDEPVGFDPATIFRTESENIAFNVFSGLVTYDGVTGEIIPDLAAEWQNDGNRVWTFHLREGLQFHKGYGEVTSEDVIYSYERILDPATGSPYASELAGIASMEAPDDHTVTITLDTPNGNFLHTVANYHQGQIVPREAVEKFGDDFAFNPIGSGPYMFSDYSPGSSFVLTRFEDYYDGPAPIERIEYSIIKDDETASVALQNGEVDLVMRQRGDERILELAQDGYRMYFREEYGISLQMFNPAVEPLADARVRRAWAHAIDWKTINDTVSPLSQSVATNILPSWMDVTTDGIPAYPYDPERAKELLAEAGYADGFSVTMLGRTSDGVEESDQLEQAYLAAVGITLEFELVDTPVNNERRNSGDFETAGRLLPAINPDMILFNYFAPENIAPAGLNGSRYDNPELYDLLLQARAAVDEEERLALYAQVQKIAMTELPYLPTYGSNQIWPAAQNVRGVAINPLAQVDLHDVYLLESP